MSGPLIFIATNRLKAGRLEAERRRVPVATRPRCRGRQDMPEPAAVIRERALLSWRRQNGSHSTCTCAAGSTSRRPTPTPRDERGPVTPRPASGTQERQTNRRILRWLAVNWAGPLLAGPERKG
jgi:hypothetical protein